MTKKEPIKISLSTCFFILALILLLVMGLYIYNLSLNKNIQEEKLKSLSRELEELKSTSNKGEKDLGNTVNLQATNVIEEEKVTETKNTNTNIQFSDEEVKKVLNGYLNNFYGAGSIDAVTYNLGIDITEYTNTDTFVENGASYRSTKMKYDDFKAIVYNYMTEECFKDFNYNPKDNAYYFKEKDGLLYVGGIGYTGNMYEVKDINPKDSKGSAYIGKIYCVYDEDRKIEEKVEFGIENYNGKCVISYCKNLANN